MEKKLRQKKIDAAAVLAEELKGSGDIFFTEYRGLSVAQVTQLRKELGKENAVYKVVKNSAAQAAFRSRGKEGEAGKYLTGPTALALARGEESGPVAKILAAFAKDNPALVLKGGFIGGEEYDAQKVFNYSKLPTRVDLIAMLARTLNEPVAGLARALDALRIQKEA